MDIENYLHTAEEIETYPAEIESLEDYEDQISYYTSRNYTYIPIPSANRYYNTQQGKLVDLDDEQNIRGGIHLMEVLRRLQDHPFLLVDRLKGVRYYVDDGEYLKRRSYGGYGQIDPDEHRPDEFTEEMDYTAEELKETYPEIVEEVIPYDDGGQYAIITIADLNKRGVKEMIYPVISELSSRLAQQIETEYPDSEEIFNWIRPETIGRWQQDKLEDIELHISDYLNLIEMQEVIKNSDGEFVTKCGFSSKNQVQKQLGGINKLRNKVMHANRTLVHEQEDIDDILRRIQRAQDIIANLN
jgi:hypothetical protein